jgi:indole-3-glycerol phosphate synthase
VSHLDRLVADARRDLERRRESVSEQELERAARHRQPRDFLAALRDPGISVIAEHKRRSPSAGDIRADLTLGEVVAAYERGGAAAISVLTDGASFGGSLADLAAAREVTELPIVRKDFIVERYQLLEAAAAGADAALIIVAALPDEDVRRLHEEARELGLTPLVEVHDAAELKRALAIGASLIGINNRNLATLEVDVRTTFELLEAIPDGVTVVAESGLRDREQLEELEAAGVDAVLIGESLMRAEDVEHAVGALLGRLTPGIDLPRGDPGGEIPMP